MVAVPTPPPTYRVRVDSAGRVLIPSGPRQNLGIQQGDEVILSVSDGKLHITTYEQALKEAQALFAKIADPSVSIVDELIRDRREEAARE